MTRRLTYYVATTLDGFIAGPEGGDPSGLEYFPVPPELVAFIVRTYPETLPGPARDALGVESPGETFDTVLEGRRSYEIGLAAGLDDAYPHLRHVVYSTTLDTVGGQVELVRTDPIEHVRALKQESGKDLWLVGGGTLAHSLLPEVDRLILKQSPWLIGEGIPLFDGPYAPVGFVPAGAVELECGTRVVTLDRRPRGAPGS